MADKSPKDIHDDWKADVDDYSFFNQTWQDWAPVYETTPVDLGDYNDWLSDDNADSSEEPQGTTTEYDPLDEADDVVRNAITSFRTWGQGPVLAAMKGLDIYSVDNKDTANQVLDWLGENYDSIFDGDYDFSDVPSIPEYTYEPVEMGLEYEPQYSDSELTIRNAYGGRHHDIKDSPDIQLNDFTEVAKTNSLYD